MALGEFISAFESVSADLERMWKGYKEGRGGAREAGVRDLVSHFFAIPYVEVLIISVQAN